MMVSPLLRAVCQAGYLYYGSSTSDLKDYQRSTVVGLRLGLRYNY